MNYVFEQKPALEDLQHFGVKGMKWGVRKARAPSTKSSSDDEVKTGMSNRKKAIIGAAVVTGVVVAGLVVAKHKGVTVSSVRNTLQKKVGERAATKAIEKVATRKQKSITEQALSNSQRQQIAAARQRMAQNRANHDRTMREFYANQTRINREANAQLRTWDNDLNIPIHQRSYLPDWEYKGAK
jgi:hypothetical protein